RDLDLREVGMLVGEGRDASDDPEAHAANLPQSRAGTRRAEARLTPQQEARAATAPAAGLRAGKAVRLRVGIEGIVQGVGFRPFVSTLATRLGLAGHVANDGHGVIAEVEGDGGAVARFLDALVCDAPPLAAIERVLQTLIPRKRDRTFTIRESRLSGMRQVPVSPDIATCPEGVRELFDPAARRHRYPL